MVHLLWDLQGSSLVTPPIAASPPRDGVRDTAALWSDWSSSTELV